MKLQRTVLLACALGLTSIASADVIQQDVEYALDNHPDGGAASPFYGLRLDGLLSGNTADIYTFDFAAPGSGMMMYWDSGTGDLRIWGDAYGGQDGGNSYLAGTTALWAIDFTYSNLYACGANICSDDGTGTISSAEYGWFDLVAVGKAMHGYTFKIKNGHRGYAGTSGLGWMNHCASGENPDSVTGGDCDRHLYASDWLFTATEVPEPATLLLLGLGLAGMGMRRRLSS